MAYLIKYTRLYLPSSTWYNFFLNSIDKVVNLNSFLQHNYKSHPAFFSSTLQTYKHDHLYLTRFDLQTLKEPESREHCHQDEKRMASNSGRGDYAQVKM